MAIFPDPSIWLEHMQWKSKYSPQFISSSSQNQLFSNFGSFQTNNYKLDDFDFDSFVNSISAHLSDDVFQNIMKTVYTDSIFKSLQLKQNSPIRIEKENPNLRRTKSFNLEQKIPILEETEEFIDFEQIDCCNFDDSSGFDNERYQSFNSLS